jgi:hypothetical protein
MTIGKDEEEVREEAQREMLEEVLAHEIWYTVGHGVPEPKGWLGAHPELVGVFVERNLEEAVRWYEEHVMPLPPGFKTILGV